MKDTITPTEAQEILKKHIHEAHLIAHMRETEVIMRALARHFGEDEDFWGITGLLHDLDYEEVGMDCTKHGYQTGEILKEEGYDIPEMFRAIKSHCEGLEGCDTARESKMEYCLAAAENITGIISAYALVRPEKKIAGTKPKSLTKKLKDKSFAANVNRDSVNDIEKAGLERSEFLAIAIAAVEEIADEVGL
jgi:uncharacterized protein